MYWDSTGDWRLTYYSNLAQRDVTILSATEKAELELDLLEKRRTQEVLNSKAEASFLDIGCGVGRQILEFSEKWTSIRFLGIDISPYQIGLLNNIVSDNQMEHVAGMVMDAGDVGKLEDKFDIISFYNNSFGCMDYEQQIKCLNALDSILAPGGTLLISCFDQLDLLEEAYAEWGFLTVNFDLATGIVDLGEYQSNWKTKDIFLPYFAQHSTISLTESEQAGLGTVYIFNKSIGGD